MKKKTLFLLTASLLSVACFLFIPRTSDEHSSVAVYRKIKDIRRPTLQDYYRIQEYLTNGKREGLEKLQDTERGMRNFTIIGQGADEHPQSGVIPIHCGMEEKENCLVLYASFNLHFREGLKKIIQLVEQSDYKGHILYYVGGWPDLEGGSLNLAHVPFAFKVCALREAQRLGYKRVLWLDSSVVPLASLNTIFNMIGRKGYFTVAGFHSVGKYCTREAAEYFGFSLEETKNFFTCQAGFLGVDVTSESGKKVMDSLYAAAHDKNAFFSPRSDQTALSLILHKYNYLDFPDNSKVAIFTRKSARPDSLFALEWDFVHN